MEFKENSTVMTAKHDKLGELEQLVIDPRTKEVKDVIVRPGIGPLKTNKVVPVSSVAATEDDEILLRPDVSDLSEFPDYREEHFVALTGRNQGKFGYEARMPMLLGYRPHSVPGQSPLPSYFRETEMNVPKDTVPLETGAPVFSVDGDHVGDIEAIYTEPESDRVSHIVITQGLLLKNKKLIPTTWVDRIEGDEVHMLLDTEIIDHLPEHKV